MKSMLVWLRPVSSMGAALMVALAAPQAQAFGGAGNLGECATFSTCTAGVYSSAFAQTKYTVTNASLAFPLGPLALGANAYGGIDFSASTAPASTAGTPCLPLCANANPWPTSSTAGSQSDYRLNRARAYAGPGGGGTDDRGQSLVARVTIQTAAEATSSWRDVWSFSADGHFSAPFELEGGSSAAPDPAWPSSFVHTRAGSTGEWFYLLRVWDTRPLGFDSDGFAAPLLMAEVRAQSANELRPDFSFAGALDFDYEAGVSYVAIAELIVKAGNGRNVDLYNTARIGDVLLSPGTTMLALSGHDYLSTAVPELQTAVLWALGLAAMGCTMRRRPVPWVA